MQDYEGSQQEEKDIEIPNSVHGMPSLFDFCVEIERISGPVYVVFNIEAHVASS
jgi:hypothetical protein